MTEADFHSITRNGELCDGEGGLGPREFELVMRKQVVRVCDACSVATAERSG
jgi:hypothetical protein